MTEPNPATRKMHPILKLVTEIGPLAAFFFANAKFGIFTATAVFMIAMVASLVISYLLVRKLAILPLITAGFVLVFGGLTIWLNNDLFIKLKPTIVNILFAGILFTGLALKKQFLQMVMGEIVQLEPEGWHKLTIRWACFFLVLAVLNEIVWRNFSTDTWVSFKVFGIMPLTMVFALSQVGLLSTYQIAPEESKKP
jgi:intracellular septation protein